MTYRSKDVSRACVRKLYVPGGGQGPALAQGGGSGPSGAAGRGGSDAQCGGGYTGLCQEVVDPQESGFKLGSFPRLREESRGWGEERAGWW